MPVVNGKRISKMYINKAKGIFLKGSMKPKPDEILAVAVCLKKSNSFLMPLNVEDWLGDYAEGVRSKKLLVEAAKIISKKRDSRQIESFAFNLGRLGRLESSRDRFRA